MSAWFCLRLASSVIGLQGHKDERKRLIETTTQQRNKSKTSSSMSVASTLYTRGYFAAPDHCRKCVLCAMDARQTQYCEWYSASVFADALVSVLVSGQDARTTLCRGRTVNRTKFQESNSCGQCRLTSRRASII